jgi:hypothetical protein
MVQVYQVRSHNENMQVFFLSIGIIKALKFSETEDPVILGSGMIHG